MMFFESLKCLKERFYEVLYGIRGECSIDFTKHFTPEQIAAFDGFIDFLANMVEKYSSKLDEMMTDKKTS